MIGAMSELTVADKAGSETLATFEREAGGVEREAEHLI